MIFEHNNYRSFLKAVLVERIAANPAYSLRAFARDLEIHPSQLSALFKGRKGLSLQSAHRVAKALGFDRDETEYFNLLVQYEASASEELKDSLLSRIRGLGRSSAAPIRELSVDVFKTISDWYHLPILEMLGIPDLDDSPTAIATRLGISPLEAEAALERLERLELVAKDEKGRYRKAQSDLLFQTRHSSRALQSFYRQMLRKASECFDKQEPRERYFASQTFAIDPAQLDQARAIMDRCASEMVELFNQGKRPKEVYWLGLQLFKLTTSPKSENPVKKGELA